MSFDPSRAATPPRSAASVILLRPRDDDGEPELFLLRRHRKASFMARAFVFPGGAADEGEEDPRWTAARELFEEAGVLMTPQPIEPERLAALRRELNQGAQGGEGAAGFAELLERESLTLDLDALRPFSHWITPSAESKRFSARFFLGVLPGGQTPSFDAVETVDEVWVTPAEGLARAAELLLPPPQLRTLYDLATRSPEGVPALLALAHERAPHVRPIVPRFLELEGTPHDFALLLPWDADYERLGQGEGEPFPQDHPFAGGPSRFVLQEDLSWAQVAGPARG